MTRASELLERIKPKRVKYKFKDWKEVEKEVKIPAPRSKIESGVTIAINVSDQDWYIAVEPWERGCFGSRGYDGSESASRIKDMYVSIMSDEYHLIPERHNYFPKHEGEFGISYIAQKFRTD